MSLVSLVDPQTEGPFFLHFLLIPYPAPKSRIASARSKILSNSRNASPLRAFEPGILLDDSPRFVAREREQGSMRGKIGEAKPRQAGLPRAEHFAFAAQAQIFLGDLKTIFRLAHDRDACLGASRQAALYTARGKRRLCRRARLFRAIDAIGQARTARHARSP